MPFCKLYSIVGTDFITDIICNICQDSATIILIFIYSAVWSYDWKFFEQSKQNIIPDWSQAAGLFVNASVVFFLISPGMEHNIHFRKYDINRQLNVVDTEIELLIINKKSIRILFRRPSPRHIVYYVYNKYVAAMLDWTMQVVINHLWICVDVCQSGF